MRKRMARKKQSKRMANKKGSLSKRTAMANNTKLIPCYVSLEKLVTLAELGLGVERPLNAEKRKWIKKLTKETDHKPILVTPIKDSSIPKSIDIFIALLISISEEIKTITIPPKVKNKPTITGEK